MVTPGTPEVKMVTLSAGFQGADRPGAWRLLPVDDNAVELADFIREQCLEPGRILVQKWEVGEFLYWATGKPVIGGFPDRRLIHEAANVFRRPDDKRYWGRKFTDLAAMEPWQFDIDELPAAPGGETGGGRRPVVKARRTRKDVAENEGSESGAKA